MFSSSVVKSQKRSLSKLLVVLMTTIFFATSFFAFSPTIHASPLTNLTASINAVNVVLLTATEGTLPGQFAVGSVSVLTTARDAAVVVRDNPASTNPQLNAAKTTLDAALATFNAGVVPSLNLANLDASISSANLALASAQPGTHPGEYLVASITILQTAVTDATTVRNSPTSDQSAIDSAKTTLDTALVTFLASVIPAPDKTNLDASITTAQTAYTTGVEGTHPGEYTPASKLTLQAAIDAAMVVSAGSAYNQAEVDLAKTTLDTAVTDFAASVIPAPDTTALDISITTATSAVTAASPGGDHPGEYSPASITTLQTAIDVAIDVKNNVTSNQAEVDTAKNILDQAIADFLASAIPSSDIGLLDISITTATSAVTAASPGGDHPGEYSPASITTLQAAIDAATIVRDDPGTFNQSEVDSAKTTLDTALTTFLASVIPAPDKTNLDASITTAQAAYAAGVEGTHPGEYTTTFKLTLQAAIDAATVVSAGSTYNQAEVDTAQATLDQAVIDFAASVIPAPDKTNLNVSITTAQATYAAGVEGNQPGQFTTANKEIFQAAIDAAIVVNIGSTYNQAEVDLAKTTLDAALTTFSASVISGGGGGGGGGGAPVPPTPPISVPPVITPPVTPPGQVLGARTWANGLLVKTADSSTVYMAVNDVLRPFSNAAVFKARGLKFQNIQVITSEELTGSTIGKPMGYPEGTLIKGQGKTIYVVGANDTKLGIPSMKVFNKKKYSLKKIVKLSEADLLLYGDGGTLQ
jgi:hypothetical protein